VRLFTLARAEKAGFTWLRDPRVPNGLALCSARGTIFELRPRPLSVRRWEEKRFKDAA
jgi:hypothetical protein